MAGKFEAGVEKNGQLTLKMKKFIVAQREKEKTPIDEIIRRVHKEFGIKTSKSAVYRDISHYAIFSPENRRNKVDHS